MTWILGATGIVLLGCGFIFGWASAIVGAILFGSAAIRDAVERR